VRDLCLTGGVEYRFWRNVANGRVPLEKGLGVEKAVRVEEKDEVDHIRIDIEKDTCLVGTEYCLFDCGGL